MSTPEGWYPDPGGNAALERFWDGAQWTHSTRPIGGVDPQQAAQVQADQAGLQAQQMQAQQADVQAQQAEMQAQQMQAQQLEAQPQQVQAQAVAAQPAAAQSQQAQQSGTQQVMDRPDPSAEQAMPNQPAMPNGNGNGMGNGNGEHSGGPIPPAGEQLAGQEQQVPMPAAPTQGGGIGGIHTDLLTDERYAEIGSDQRVSKQNAAMLKVVLGNEVLARQGSMVAYQGQIDFKHEGSGAAKFVKKAVSGEGLPLMRCSGQGEIFFADRANKVHIIYLEGAGITVNGSNVLAFETSLQWDIERVKGGAMAAGGLFNTRLQGHGWVAITTDGDPVVLNTNQPTFVDTDAVVAWSSNLQTKINTSMKAGALIGRGSGEAMQLALQGEGMVIVQPSEGAVIPVS